MLELSFPEAITLLLILGTVVVQVATDVKPYVVYLGAMAVLLLTDVLTPKEAFSGFSNSSVVSIAILFIVCEGMIHTGVVKIIVNRLFGRPKSLTNALLRMMLPIAAISAFVLNGALATLLVNGITSWSKKLKISPSKLLIPMSFAICMGGMLTLMGKASNLVISSSYTEITGEQMSFFAPTQFGFLCLLVGTLTTILFQRLLPERKSVQESLANSSEYLAEFVVPSDSPLVGKTIEESGVKNIPGTSLLKIIIHYDNEEINGANADEDFIIGGDRLVFVGKIGNILKHSKQMGLVPTSLEKAVYRLNDPRHHHTSTAMVTIGSSLIGKTWLETGLGREDIISLVAVSRHSTIVEGSPMQVVFQAGDTLLIEHAQAASKMAKAIGSDLQFFDSEEVISFSWRTWASVAIIALMVGLMIFNIMPITKAVTLAAILILVTECCPVEQAFQSIKWKMLMTLAGAIVLGTAVSRSGLAHDAATLMQIVSQGNVIGTLIAFGLMALILSNFIGSTAVAAIFAPIAISTAQQLGCAPMPFCLCTMFATTFCFATPIGCPSNVVVFFNGGYRYSDFIRIGLPVILITWMVATIYLITFYHLI